MEKYRIFNDSNKIKYKLDEVCIITCNVQISINCKKTYLQTYKKIIEIYNKNNKLYICENCLTNKLDICENKIDINNFIKYKYISYLLGWIYTRGIISRTIIKIILPNEKHIIELFKKIFSKNLKYIEFEIDENFIIIIKYSEFIKFIYTIFDITEDNNISKYKFPIFNNRINKIAFIRALYESYGSMFNNKTECIRIILSDLPKHYITEINNCIKIPYTIENNKLIYENYNAIDFLHYLYTDKEYLYNNKKYNKYINFLKKINYINIQYIMIYKNTIKPNINRITDAGIDLCIIKLNKKIGNVEFYDTGLILVPPLGYYLKLYPRSSLSKTGYMLVNSVGIIDSTYRGTIIVPLIKIDKKNKDIELPNKCVQIIPEKNIFCNINNLSCTLDNNIIKTERNNDGFGSTN